MLDRAGQAIYKTGTSCAHLMPKEGIMKFISWVDATYLHTQQAAAAV